MKKYRFQSYQIADKINLDPFLAYFPSLKQYKKGEFIFLNSPEIEQVLKYYAENKYLYLFSFGSITFINFEHDEILTFISFLKTMVENIHDSYLLSYQESYELYIDPQQTAKIEKNFSLLPMEDDMVKLGIASILAKSTAMDKIEEDVESFLEECESMIKDLGKGKIFTRRRQIFELTSKIISFELKVVSNIKIFERPFTNPSWLIEKYYDQLYQLYNLSQRFTIIKEKLEDLDIIKSTFYELSINKTISNLYLTEIFLLLIFVFVDIFFYLFEPSALLNTIKYIF
ncbi:MAG TPA: RMD1 family protein [Clostridia bacterium]|nr:RMD1 family protein [Clostridia bacterium]